MVSLSIEKSRAIIVCPISSLDSEPGDAISASAATGKSDFVWEKRGMLKKNRMLTRSIFLHATPLNI